MPCVAESYPRKQSLLHASTQGKNVSYSSYVDRCQQRQRLREDKPHRIRYALIGICVYMLDILCLCEPMLYAVLRSHSCSSETWKEEYRKPSARSTEKRRHTAFRSSILQAYVIPLWKIDAGASMVLQHDESFASISWINSS